MSQQNNGGLPLQQISGEPARNAAIKQQIEANEKQLSLIGGRKKKYMRGGEGDIPSPSPISPPIVPNTGSTSETRSSQQDSYNQLAKLSGNVNEQSRYDKVGGKRKKVKRTSRTNRMRKSRKYKRTRSKRSKKNKTRR